MPKRRWFDAHLDLAYLAVCGRDLNRAPAELDLAVGCVTLPALREANVQCMLATIFTEPGENAVSQGFGYSTSDDVDGAERAGMRQLEIYEKLERDGRLKIVRSRNDLVHDSPVSKGIILMEGADPIRSPDDVGQWHARGLRVVGLTWAAGSRYAGGNSDGGPLTGSGRELVAALDALNIVHDVSHLSDEAFEGLMSTASGPIIASHSNCRALLEPKERHLRDDQIRAIVARGGIIGLNLYSSFLAKGRRATIDDCIGHIEHVCEVAGDRGHVGLGSDMDGGFPPSQLPVGLDHPIKLEAMADALVDARWSDEDVEGFAWRNWQAFFERSLPR